VDISIIHRSHESRSGNECSAAGGRVGTEYHPVSSDLYHKRYKFKYTAPDKTGIIADGPVFSVQADRRGNIDIQQRKCPADRPIKVSGYADRRYG
jgi:hypothetical protein